MIRRVKKAKDGVEKNLCKAYNQEEEFIDTQGICQCTTDNSAEQRVRDFNPKRMERGYPNGKKKKRNVQKSAL